MRSKPPQFGALLSGTILLGILAATFARPALAAGSEECAHVRAGDRGDLVAFQACRNATVAAAVARAKARVAAARQVRHFAQNLPR